MTTSEYVQFLLEVKVEAQPVRAKVEAAVDEIAQISGSFTYRPPCYFIAS